MDDDDELEETLEEVFQWGDSVAEGYGGPCSMTGVPGNGRTGSGNNVSEWDLEQDGHLTVRGKGNLVQPFSDIRSRAFVRSLTADAPGIGDQAFEQYCWLQSVDLRPGMKILGSSAFYDCWNLRRVTFPDGLTTVGDGAFSGCDRLEEVHLPDTVTSIGGMAFSGCACLKFVRLPSHLKFIDDFTFVDCLSLETITIPARVQAVGLSAFMNCVSLKHIAFLGHAPRMNETAFLEVSAAIYYPAGDESWESLRRENFGEDLVWIPYDKTRD